MQSNTGYAVKKALDAMKTWYAHGLEVLSSMTPGLVQLSSWCSSRSRERGHGGPNPFTPVKTSKKKMAAVWGRKFHESSGPFRQTSAIAAAVVSRDDYTSSEHIFTQFFEL